MKSVEKMFMLAVCVVFVFGGMSMASLVAYYHFDEDLSATRTLANEVSGDWGDATASAFVNNTGGPYMGESLWFNGAGSYVDTDNKLSATGNWTLSCWSRARDTAYPLYPYNRHFLFSQYSGYSAEGRMYLMGTETADGFEGKARLRISGSAGDIVSIASNVSLIDSAYHFITAVRDGNTFSLYVDGVFQDSVTVSDVTLDINTNLLVGNAMATDTFGNGYCDEITIYDNALSAQEIAAAYVPEPASMVIIGLGSLIVFGTKRSA